MAWTRVASEESVVPGQATIVTANDKEIGLFCEGGQYYAVLNFCPHFGAPVCAGKVFAGCVTTPGGAGQPLGFNARRKVLRCPWHHWEFDLQTGEALAPIRQRLKVYPVRVESGEVWVDF